jgi:hypothetical protein
VGVVALRAARQVRSQREERRRRVQITGSGVAFRRGL